MKRIIVPALIFVLGASAGWLLANYSPKQSKAPVFATRTPATTDSFELPVQEPKISDQELADHRETHYEELETVGEIAGLPTDFAQTEALYALAGRADIQGLQALIQQAEALPSRYDRRAALRILFMRYAEVDPRGGVEYLESMNLDIDTQVLTSIFYSWAKVDLEMAIDTANAYTNTTRRRIAGQAILNATTELYPGSLKSVADRLIDFHNVEGYQARTLATEANRSPELALDEALRLSNPNQRMQAVNNIGTVWARTDPEGALAYADTLTDRMLRERFKYAVLARWLSDDPDAATATLDVLPDSPEKDQLRVLAINNVGTQDPLAAMRMADELRGDAKLNAYSQIFANWIRQDLQGALQQIEAIPDTQLRTNLISNFAYRYTHQNPDEALAWAQQLRGPDRNQALDSMLSSLARIDPQKALDFTSSLESNSERMRLLPNVLTRVAMSQPELAVQYVDRLEGPQRGQLMGQVASQWARRDPEAAFSWLDTADDQVYQQAIHSIASQMAHQDPDMAASYVNRVRGVSRDAWISAVSGRYAQSDPQQALNWLQQFKNEPVYDQAMQNVIPSLARQDPQRALRLAQNSGGENQPYLVQSVLQHWAQSDVQGAANWVLSADAETQANTAPSVAQQWAQYDFTRAKSWASRLSDSYARDQALAGIISHAPTDQQAKTILDSIESQDQRDAAAMQIFYKRVRTNPAGARSFMNSSGVSDQARQQMEQILQNPPRGRRGFGVGG